MIALDTNVLVRFLPAEAEEIKKRLLIGSIAMMFALYVLFAILFKAVMYPFTCSLL
jgi:predicted nucleic-acid-binding protein